MGKFPARLDGFMENQLSFLGHATCAAAVPTGLPQRMTDRSMAAMGKCPMIFLEENDVFFFSKAIRGET